MLTWIDVDLVLIRDSCDWNMNLRVNFLSLFYIVVVIRSELNILLFIYYRGLT
jgi:hypothetical protein